MNEVLKWGKGGVIDLFWSIFGPLTVDSVKVNMVPFIKKIILNRFFTQSYRVKRHAKGLGK